MGAGLAALIVFILLSAHSCWTLSVHARKLQLDSYPDLVVNVLGERGRSLCNIMISLYARGGGVSFWMILKGELRYLAAQIWLADTPPHRSGGDVVRVLPRHSSAQLLARCVQVEVLSRCVFGP